MNQDSRNEYRDLPKGADVANTSGFLKSLVFLLAALSVAFLVFYPSKRQTWGDVDLATKSTGKEASNDKRAQSRDRFTKSGAANGSSDRVLSDSSSSGDLASASSLNTAHVPKTEGYEYRGSSPGTITSNLTAEMQKAVQLIDAGKPEEAVTILEAILKAEPKNEQALVELAMVNLLDLKRPEIAVQWLEKGAAINPENRIVMSELVNLYSETQQVEAGLAFLRDLAAQKPESSDIAYGLGQLLANEGRDSEAIPFLEKAAGTAEQKDRVLQELGDAYSRQSDSVRAAESYQRSIEIQGGDIAAKMQQGLPVGFAEERLNSTKLDLARELYQMGQVSKATALAEEVQARSPDGTSAKALLAQFKRVQRP